MIKMPVGAKIPPHWISAVESTEQGTTMIIPMPARSSKTDELYSVFMLCETRELRCDCLGFQTHKHCFHVKWLPLACYKPGRKRGAQDTQLEAYYSLAPEVLADSQLAVYSTLVKAGRPLSDSQIVQRSHKRIQNVTARRNELMDFSLVREAGEAKDPISNVMVKLWEAVGCDVVAGLLGRPQEAAA